MESCSKIYSSVTLPPSLIEEAALHKHGWEGLLLMSVPVRAPVAPYLVLCERFAKLFLEAAPVVDLKEKRKKKTTTQGRDGTARRLKDAVFFFRRPPSQAQHAKLASCLPGHCAPEFSRRSKCPLAGQMARKRSKSLPDSPSKLAEVGKTEAVADEPPHNVGIADYFLLCLFGLASMFILNRGVQFGGWLRDWTALPDQAIE